MQYRADRYMAHLSPAELRQRFLDVLSNTVELLDSGQLGLAQAPADPAFWMSRFTHLHEEFTLRQTGLPAFPSLGPDAPKCLPRPTHPDHPPSVAILKTLPARGDALFKYGQHQNLKKVFTEGTIRLNPASSYEDPSLNPAVRDAELTFTYQVRPSPLTGSFTDPLNGTTLLIPPGQGFKYTVSTDDYLVFCCAAARSNRLYQAFPADACLVITDPSRFLREAGEAGQGDLPGYSFGYAGVRYVDPLIATPDGRPVHAIKHFRFAYQKEFRCIWQPKPGASRLEPVDLRLPHLRDYSVLVAL
jgi:hypothetical protein